jgi:thiamine pyrophosphokinase
MSKPRAVLVAGAPMRWRDDSASLASGTEILLAADGGANSLARIGLRPAAVIGDLDSLDQETRAWLGEEVIVHRPDQDRTDLDKAIEYAFDHLHVDEVIVLAALGGRTDHDLGNLGLLARLGLGDRLVFVGDAYRALAFSGETVLEAVPGETWSFWNYDPGVRVSVTGVKWPLANAAVDAGGRPSISNEAVADRISISVTGGSVVVFRHLAS